VVAIVLQTALRAPRSARAGSSRLDSWAGGETRRAAHSHAGRRTTFELGPGRIDGGCGASCIAICSKAVDRAATSRARRGNKRPGPTGATPNPHLDHFIGPVNITSRNRGVADANSLWLIDRPKIIPGLSEMELSSSRIFHFALGVTSTFSNSRSWHRDIFEIRGRASPRQVSFRFLHEQRVESVDNVFFGPQDCINGSDRLPLVPAID